MLNVSEAEWTLRVDLAAAFHMAVANNLHEAIANHFSAVLPDAPHFLVNPFGLHFSEITASNLIVCDFNGKVVRGDGGPYATALTMVTGGRIEWAMHTACRFYGRVTYDTDYDGVALSDSVGERMARIIGDTDILFLGNHGVITIAPTVAQAFDDLYFVERVAQTQILAMSSGQPLNLLAPEMIETVAAQTQYERFELGYIERHFNAQKRLLDLTGGFYRS